MHQLSYEAHPKVSQNHVLLVNITDSIKMVHPFFHRNNSGLEVANCSQ